MQPIFIERGLEIEVGVKSKLCATGSSYLLGMSKLYQLEAIFTWGTKDSYEIKLAMKLIQIPVLEGRSDFEYSIMEVWFYPLPGPFPHWLMTDFWKEFIVSVNYYEMLGPQLWVPFEKVKHRKEELSLPNLSPLLYGHWSSSGPRTSIVAVLGRAQNMVVTCSGRSSVLKNSSTHRKQIVNFICVFSFTYLTRRSYAFCLTPTETCMLIC